MLAAHSSVLAAGCWLLAVRPGARSSCSRPNGSQRVSGARLESAEPSWRQMNGRANTATRSHYVTRRTSLRLPIADCRLPRGRPPMKQRNGATRNEAAQEPAALATGRPTERGGSYPTAVASSCDNATGRVTGAAEADAGRRGLCVCTGTDAPPRRRRNTAQFRTALLSTRTDSVWHCSDAIRFPSRVRTTE